MGLSTPRGRPPYPGCTPFHIYVDIGNTLIRLHSGGDGGARDEKRLTVIRQFTRQVYVANVAGKLHPFKRKPFGYHGVERGAFRRVA
jgi:hypothetical protein